MSENPIEKENANNKNSQSGEKDYKPSIEDFICDEYSICREERQYAVFLYNVLRRYSTPESRKGYNKKAVGEIFTACGLEDAVVEDVFYEATFMRDFFERNRLYVLPDLDEKKVKERILSPKKILRKKCKQAKDAFNYKLIQYVGKWEKIELEYHGKEFNLGHNVIESDKIISDGKELAPIKINRIESKTRWMMNAKPDIAVIYHMKGKEKKYLLFLECKFESREDYYLCKAEDNPQKNEKYEQRKIQWRIADFLCDHYLETEKITVSEKMENKESRLVQFTRDKKDKEKGQIFIGDLIRIERNIFS